MIGHKQIINLREHGMKPKSVFFKIAEHPKFKTPMEDPEMALEQGYLPEVYTGITDPKKTDLAWIKGLCVHLIGGDVESHINWWISIVDAEPKLLIGIDWEDQINIWRQE
jgi:hypothetical protein